MRSRRAHGAEEQVHRGADHQGAGVEAGAKTADVCRRLGVTEQTFYRWKSKFGGLEVSEAKRLKQLEDENRRLKQMVAEQTLELQAAKLVLSRKW